MKNVILLSGFLLAGLVASQILPSFIHAEHYAEYTHIIKFLTTMALGFIMIRVGYEFDIDKTRLKSYGWDYIVAATAATFPWIFVAVYFVVVLADSATLMVWK